MLSSGWQLTAHLPALTVQSCRPLQDPGKAPKIEEATGAHPKRRKVALIVKLMKLMQEAEKGRPEAEKRRPNALPSVHHQVCRGQG